jgi:acyl carrier protein
MKFNYLNELNKIFIKYFNNNKIKLTENTSSKNIKNWDSLAQVSLVILIEKKFKLRLSVKEVNNLNNVGDMISLIKKKSKKK